MAKVIIIGDGPGGLSAALFLAKLEMGVTVFGVDKTAMHAAMLYNYLGIPEMTGSEFQKIARQQVIGFGADLQNKLVTGIEKTRKQTTASQSPQRMVRSTKVNTLYWQKVKA